MARVELYGSRNVTYNEDGIMGQRRFVCLWSERFAVKPAIGEPFPDLSGLYCSQVRIEGTGQSVAGGGHTHAFIYADYTTRTTSRQQTTGRLFDESLEFSGEMLTRAGGKWKDCEEVVSEVDIGGQWFPRVEYIVEKTYASITEIAKQLLKATGTVNSSTFLGVEPEKWLLQGASASTFVDDKGSRKWRIVMRFVYNEIGWNKQWHKRCTVDGNNNVRARWEEILYQPEDGGGFTEKMYALYDFNQLVPERKI